MFDREKNMLTDSGLLRAAGVVIALGFFVALAAPAASADDRGYWTTSDGEALET